MAGNVDEEAAVEILETTAGDEKAELLDGDKVYVDTAGPVAISGMPSIPSAEEFIPQVSNPLDNRKKATNSMARHTTKIDEHLIPAWLSAELRLDDHSIKDQTFVISGWINVSWIWRNAPSELRTFQQDKNGEIGPSHMIMYTDSKGHQVVKVNNLLKSSLSYYLPIDATKVFYQPSLLDVKHIDDPVLYYNKETCLAHTQFYVSAQLLEQLELFLFPFDKQFLNIKLRWNTDYYRILDYDDETERRIPIEENWWGEEGDQTLKRNKELYYDQPIKVSLQEVLTHEVDLLPCWVVARTRHSKYAVNQSTVVQEWPNLRFALIRLRIQRNPIYFITNVLFPLFVIVACSFSIFAIDLDDTGSRLEISVTILLTFTAFQTFIDNMLPVTSEMLFSDWYISLAYMLQAMLILGSCVVGLMQDTGDYDHGTLQYVDWVFCLVMAIFWIGLSGFYLALYTQCCRDMFDESWDTRGRREISTWNNSQKFLGYEKFN